MVASRDRFTAWDGALTGSVQLSIRVNHTHTGHQKTPLM